MIDDESYRLCCEIVDRMEDFESSFLGQMVISIIANFPETRQFILNQYSDILNDGE